MATHTIAPARTPAIVTALPSASGAPNPPAPATSPAAPGADPILRLTALACMAGGRPFDSA